MPSSRCGRAQLTERRKGNEHFRAKRFEQALVHYEAALNIVNFVVRSGPCFLSLSCPRCQCRMANFS